MNSSFEKDIALSEFSSLFIEESNYIQRIIRGNI